MGWGPPVKRCHPVASKESFAGMQKLLSQNCCEPFIYDILPQLNHSEKLVGQLRLDMAETEAESVPTSGFKVRPLSRVAKPDAQAAGGGQQKAESSIPEPHDSKFQSESSRLREL